jgi:hypothetical protein
MDQSEHGRINNVLNSHCPGLTMSIPTGPITGTITTTPPATVATVTVVTVPAVTVPVVTVPVVTVPAATDVHFANCDAVRAAGLAPLHTGDPGYRAGLDRDGDGIACE